MSENTELIVVSQLPVIEEQLRALKERWEEKAALASSMICTEETVQSLKNTRAEMRKEFEDADTQRKAAKAKYIAPWEQVEAVFKECVKDAFTRADASLKDSISSFETELKEKCKADLQAYFAELIAMEQIDFLSFEQAMSIGNIKISLADTKKKTPRQLQDALASVVSRVAVGMEQISQMEDAPAIMAEYKQCFDVGKAVSIVQGRKRREQAEIEAAEARRAEQERQAAAVAKVEAAAPKMAAAPVAVPAAPVDPVFPEFIFTVYGARKSQLLKVREFLKKEGIEYK